jgi:hypothetical protein
MDEACAEARKSRAIGVFHPRRKGNVRCRSREALWRQHQSAEPGISAKQATLSIGFRLSTLQRRIRQLEVTDCDLISGRDQLEVTNCDLKFARMSPPPALRVHRARCCNAFERAAPQTLCLDAAWSSVSDPIPKSAVRTPTFLLPAFYLSLIGKTYRN